MTQRFQMIQEKSYSRPRDGEKVTFDPQKVTEVVDKTSDLEEFVVKPLYTKAELHEFRKKHEVNGTFRVDHDTVHSMEDLEKLLFIWQDATELAEKAEDVEIGEEYQTADGMRYTGFSIRRKQR